jgi:hypothetical protein
MPGAARRGALECGQLLFVLRELASSQRDDVGARGDAAKEQLEQTGIAQLDLAVLPVANPVAQGVLAARSPAWIPRSGAGCAASRVAVRRVDGHLDRRPP